MSIFKTLTILATFLTISFGFIPSVNNVAFKAQSKCSTQLYMTVLNYKGKKIDVKQGTPLKNAVAKLGYPVRYSCKKGDCATCAVSVGGKRMKPCVDKVPPAPKLKSLQEKGLPVQ
eukprot:CAMPEP_0172500386 /NCGR_PEP_ID=MMETSP1066-20121228/137474_1 /TAXON_ID=671091 /ORGANISM="Coscinodiscus wailesii, Strain CCMP2513" /LENGTH=115 /DNA_ID=CAMNT_0013274585 /DNA_START=107 /DNA_END=454 /DNA_ORIENTATION=+